MPPQPPYIELACKMLGRNTEPDEEQMLFEVQGLLARAGHSLGLDRRSAGVIAVALVLFRDLRRDAR